MRLPVLICLGAIAAPLAPAVAQFAPHPPVMAGIGHSAVVPAGAMAWATCTAASTTGAGPGS